MEETLILHCDNCGRECYAPTDEQIAAWESSTGMKYDGDIPLWCSGCVDGARALREARMLNRDTRGL